MSQLPVNRNRYPGINPHLNSALQQEGWKGFHTLHLSDIGDVVEAALPPGYYTSTEPSLQITAKEEEEFVSSVVIYHDKTAVTRIELLSPANKHPGSHHKLYLEKREATLKSGISLVEVDYLHERYPVIHRIPPYPDKHPAAQPYCIIISNPHPSLRQGQAEIYSIGILEALAVLDIPLEGEATIAVDFNRAYQTTFNRRKEFYEILTDDTKPPVNFHAYSPADRTLILQHIAKLATGE